MTSRYSHDGYGWNQQLRHAVTFLHSALLSYGRPAEDATSNVRVANSRRDEGVSLVLPRYLSETLTDQEDRTTAVLYQPRGDTSKKQSRDGPLSFGSGHNQIRFVPVR